MTEPTDALGKIMLLQLEEEKIKAEKEEAAKKEEERKEEEKRKAREEMELLKDSAPSMKVETDDPDTAPSLSTGTPTPDKAPALTTDYPPEKRRSRVVELNSQLELIKVS